MDKRPDDRIMLCYPSKACAPEHLQSLDGWYCSVMDGFTECIDITAVKTFLKERAKRDELDKQFDKRLEEIAKLKMTVRELKAENKVLMQH